MSMLITHGRHRGLNCLQIEAHVDLGDGYPNDDVLRDAGVKRVRDGWYTIFWEGNNLDRTTIRGARRNPRGEFRDSQR